MSKQAVIDKVNELFDLIQAEYPGTVVYFDTERMNCSFSIGSEDCLLPILQNNYGMTPEDAEAISTMDKATIQKLIIQSKIEKKKAEIRELEGQL